MTVFFHLFRYYYDISKYGLIQENTHLERAMQELRNSGRKVDDKRLPLHALESLHAAQFTSLGFDCLNVQLRRGSNIE